MAATFGVVIHSFISTIPPICVYGFAGKFGVYPAKSFVRSNSIPMKSNKNMLFFAFRNTQ